MSRFNHSMIELVANVIKSLNYTHYILILETLCMSLRLLQSFHKYFDDLNSYQNMDA